MHKLVVLTAIIGLLGAACKPTTSGSSGDDGGAACPKDQKLVNGECRFVCGRDGDCAAGQRCNLLVGQCEPKPAATDAGAPVARCTNGAVRCSTDNKSIQRCQPDGTFVLDSTCPTPNGFCENGQCLACRPGATACTSSSTVDVCDELGKAFHSVTCVSGATCANNECQACTTGAKRCSTDGKSLQECQRQANPASSTAWVNAGDNFDGACVTQQCVTAGSSAACKPPACVPGATQCKNAQTQQLCNAVGSYDETVCSTLPGAGPTSECIGGACVDECADAVKAKSYFGCEYWAANLDNSVDALFKAKTASGQGMVDSDYVFVVTNQSTSPATVTVQRFVGTAIVTVKTVTVPGRTDAATKGLVKIPVPWQSQTSAAVPVATGVTGRARFAYHLVSTKPITVYQFNPIDAVKLTKSCSAAPGQLDCSCNEFAGYPGNLQCSFGGPLVSNVSTVGTCTSTPTGNKCGYNTFSNDASLLLPAHILGLSHVALAPGSAVGKNGSTRTVYGGQVAIVATADNTTVTVKASGPIAAGTDIAAMAQGESRDFVLNSYEVLQLTSGDGADIECANPFCRIASDLTGTIVISDKPVAVFGGHPCAQVPYDKFACDHVEEQLFPFETWGKSFAMVPSAPILLSNGNQSGTPPSYYKVVAGCPLSKCPNGTLLTLNPAPSASDVLAPLGCTAGTSLQANNCRLSGASFVEFRASRAFTLVADQPISVAQFLTGEEATSSSAVEGDPSMILLPPVEQWRSRYTVLAATGLAHNFLGLAIDSSRVSAVLVDGVAISGFQAITGSTYQFKNHPVSTGTHTIQVNAAAGQSTLPGAGVTIYGYDSYVSYGYTGGLDLSTLVTGTNPGG